MGTKYIHAAQDDLKIRFDFADDLTSYTGVMYYYKESDGNAARATVTATITVVTSVLAYVSYTLATQLFTTADSNYYCYMGLTSTTGNTRSSAPVVIPVNTEGKIPYALTD